MHYCMHAQFLAVAIVTVAMIIRVVGPFLESNAKTATHNKGHTCDCISWVFITGDLYIIIIINLDFVPKQLDVSYPHIHSTVIIYNSS